MPNLSRVAHLALVAALHTLLFSSTTFAQSPGTRTSMERCVDGVLSKMARAKAPEAQVGKAVVSQCDKPLRAALASAIQTGEAPMCSVESCIAMARERAAEEATSAYRQRVTR